MTQDLLDATARGLAFLEQRQLSSGQFATYTGDLSTADVVFEPSPFATSLIVLCLRFSSDPTAAAMRVRAASFLRSQMERSGVWRHWLIDDPRHGLIPPDSDDTACVSLALSHEQVRFPNNRPLLLANRDQLGRFYTWFTPRFRPFPASRKYWRVAAQRWESPIRSFIFWRAFDAARRDVDGVVNANVLLYLGDGPEARPVSDYLLRILTQGREATCDKWYQSAMMFYYAVARCIRGGFESLGPARPIIIDRIGNRRNEDGTVESNHLESALATCALLHCDASGGVVEDGIARLLETQLPSGAWPIAPFYYSGPSRLAAFGSEELSTAVCIEALSCAMSTRC